MSRKKKIFFKNFWGLIAGITTITAITTGSVLSTNNNHSSKEAINNFLNQNSSVPSSDDFANQSDLLQQNIKNNNLVQNSNDGYFNVKYNNQTISSTSLSEIGIPQTFFESSESYENFKNNLDKNIILNLRRQGDLQKKYQAWINSVYNAIFPGNHPNNGIFKFSIRKLNLLHPNVKSRVTLSRHNLFYYEKYNPYSTKQWDNKTTIETYNQKDKLSFISSQIDLLKTPKIRLTKEVKITGFPSHSNLYYYYWNLEDYISSWKYDNKKSLDSQKPNAHKFNKNDVIPEFNPSFGTKEIDLSATSNKLSNLDYYLGNNLYDYNSPYYYLYSILTNRGYVWIETSDDSQNAFIYDSNELRDAFFNFLVKGDGRSSNDQNTYTKSLFSRNSTSGNILSGNGEAKQYDDYGRNVISWPNYGKKVPLSQWSHLLQYNNLPILNNNLFYKEILLNQNDPIYLNIENSKSPYYKHAYQITEGLNTPNYIFNNDTSGVLIQFFEGNAIAHINFLKSPHYYSNFLTFLSKQISIDPNSGLTSKFNSVDNGIYSNLDASKNLKFAFNDDFAYLINQLNVYNYYLQNSKSKTITDTRVQTFKSIIEKASKSEGDDGIFNADLIFLNNFYNLKYDAQTINKLLDSRFDVANSNSYLLNVSQTTTKITSSYSKVFANPDPAVLEKIYENRDFISEAAKTTFNALMDLPSLLSETLKNKEITANVNYGVAGKDIRIPIWQNNSFQPIPEFPNLPDPNQNILYLSSANTQNNITQITINDLAFDNSIPTDDYKNIDNSILASSINEFDKKHPTQDTLKVVNNSAIQYTINYRKDYKNFSFSPKISNVTQINNGIPVIDIDAGYHRDWLATQYEQNFISTQAQNSINNYFGQIDPTYLRNGGFVLYSTFGVNEVLNTNDPVFTEKLRSPLNNVIKKYNLNVKPNDDTGSFYRIVRLNNANDLGNQQRAEHPAPFVWYLGDVQDNPANSYYLMQFEAPNKIYNLNNLNIDSKTKSLYFENKSASFVAYSKNQGDGVCQSDKLTFEPKGIPTIKTTNDQEFLDVSFEKPLGVQFLNLSESIVPSKIASDLVGLYAKDYIYSANISKARQTDRDTLNFQIGLSKKADISPIININRNSDAINFLNQSKTISNKDSSTLGNPQDDPNFPKKQPGWTDIISFPIKNNKLNYKEWWHIPYKVTNLGDNKKHVELLWNQSPNQHNLTLTVFSPDRDIWMDTLINDLQNIFFKPTKDTNGNQINYSFNSNIKDTLVVNSDDQTANPWFDVNISTSNNLGGTNNPGSVNSESSNPLSSGAQAGIGIGVTGSVAATAGTVIFIHRKRNRKLLNGLRKAKPIKKAAGGDK